MRRTIFYAVLLLSSLGSRAALAADTDCGNPWDSPGRFGPFDYLDPTKDEERYLVDSAHFTNYMEEMALYGFSSRHAQIAAEADGWSLVAGNLDYTLHAFPNHSRALYAMSVWQLRYKRDAPASYADALRLGRLISPDCYFQRGLMLTPNDGLVHHAYGAFLQKIGDLRNAAIQYQKAIELLPEAPESHYNLGLLYLDLGDLAKASEHAARAYELGYPLQGLKRKLAAAEHARH